MKGPISATTLVIVTQSRNGGARATGRTHARRRIASGPRPRREREHSSAQATRARSEAWWLAGAGPERKRDVAPRVEVRRRCRQMEDEAAHRHDDMDAECEQTLPQCGHLRAGARRARGPQPEFLHEHVRRGGEEHAQLIGPEAPAAG